MDPARRDVPDARIASERLIGHLFDNPFNENVRSRIYNMLEHIHKYYQIEEVIIDHEKMKKAPCRFMDPKRVAGVIPIIPDFNQILELYGVGHVLTKIIWPKINVERHRFTVGDISLSPERFYTAQDFYKYVWDNILELSPNKRKKVCKQVSPFVPPVNAKGYHGGRFEYAIKHFGILYSRVLDYGSHPGAAAFSIMKDKNVDLTCVTLVPEYDKKIMPYVVLTDKVKVHQIDADEFLPVGSYDLVHDDVDVVGLRTNNTNQELAVKCLRRFRKYFTHFKQCLMTVHEVTPIVLEELYETYRMYGHFDIHYISFEIQHPSVMDNDHLIHLI